MDLDEEREQWRREHADLASLRKLELDLQRRMRAVRQPDAGTSSEGRTPCQATEFEAIRQERADVQQRIHTSSQCVGALTRNLAERSRAEVLEAIRRARTDVGGKGDEQWQAARETLMGGLPERLALLIEEEGLRPMSARCGISHTYLSRMMRGQRPKDAPLEALATSYPEAFPDIPVILEACPQTARMPGRPLKQPEAKVGRPGLRALEKRPQFRLDSLGRTRRVPGVLSERMGQLANADADYLLLVEGEWLAPAIRPGDVLLVSVNTPPQPGGIVLVEASGKRSSLRRVSAGSAGQTVYSATDPVRFPDLSPAEATVTGAAVGVLRCERFP